MAQLGCPQLTPARLLLSPQMSPSGSGLEASGLMMPTARYTVDIEGNVLYEYDPEYVAQKYEMFNLKIIHGRHRTGFEESKEFPIRQNDLVAGRYQVRGSQRALLVCGGSTTRSPASAMRWAAQCGAALARQHRL